MTDYRFESLGKEWVTIEAAEIAALRERAEKAVALAAALREAEERGRQEERAACHEIASRVAGDCADPDCCFEDVDHGWHRRPWPAAAPRGGVMTWTIKRHGYESPYMVHAFIEDEKGNAVCGIWWPEGDTEQEANAKLIAEAPALRERAEKAERERDSLAADYQRIIREVLACEPKPASDRPEDQLEPPWEVVKRVRRERDEARGERTYWQAEAHLLSNKLAEAREDIRALATVAGGDPWPQRPEHEAAWRRIRDRRLAEVSE